MENRKQILVVDQNGNGIENVFIETENAYTTGCSGKLVIETSNPTTTVKISAFGAETLEIPFCLLSGKIRLSNGKFEQLVCSSASAEMQEETSEVTTATTTVATTTAPKEMTIIEKHWGKAALAGLGFLLISKMGSNE